MCPSGTPILPYRREQFGLVPGGSEVALPPSTSLQKERLTKEKGDGGGPRQGPWSTTGTGSRGTGFPCGAGREPEGLYDSIPHSPSTLDSDLPNDPGPKRFGGPQRGKRRDRPRGTRRHTRVPSILGGLGTTRTYSDRWCDNRSWVGTHPKCTKSV